MAVRAGSEPEWPATLDVQELISQGWQPVPFREFVLKVHSRCDLACDYCYVYKMADQSWRHQPLVMSRSVLDQAAARIGEHVTAHRLSSVKLVLHGGEPLLAGPEVITHAVTAVRNAVGPGVRTSISVQTNGLGLDTAWLKLFAELDVRIGVSLDGDAAAQDRHRRYANGRGSHAGVELALRRLAAGPYRHLFGGLLCTVDVRNDPVATYEALLKFSPPMIDFLLPHGNWTSPPDRGAAGSSRTPYADWLIAVFDRWYGVPRRETQVRLLSEMMHLLLGGASSTEAIGLSPVAVAVIETDGHIEQSDTLKSAFSGAPVTGFHVDSDSFDAALLQPAVAARQIGVNALPSGCRACRVLPVCGGGHYAHRYRSGSGFFNPSVYCPDLIKLITHVKRSMDRDIAAFTEKRE